MFLYSDTEIFTGPSVGERRPKKKTTLHNKQNGQQRQPIQERTMSTTTSTTNPDWFFSSLAAGTGLSAWKYVGLTRQVHFSIHNSGQVSIGGASDDSYRSANAKLTLNASYSGGDTEGFCINATDMASDPNRYNLRIYPYVQGGAQVAYRFRTYNVGTHCDAMNIGYNGFIGIGGVSHPTTLLDISHGHPTFLASDNYIRVRVQGGGVHSGISLTENNWYGHTIRYNQNSDALVFSTQDETPSFTDRMTLTYDGRLGIGTSTPTQALHVVGNINFTGTLIQNGSPFQTSQWTTEPDDSITFDGFVGIGTEGEPEDNLHLGAGNDVLRIGATDFVGEASDTTTYGLERSRNSIVFSTYRDVVVEKIGAKIVGINKQTYMVDGNRHLIQSTDLVFFTSPPNMSGVDDTYERLRIADNGNIGIGTSAPIARFHIDQGGSNNLALRLSSSGPGWGSGFHLVNDSVGGRNYGLYSGASGLLQFADNTAGVDRMRIDASGNIIMFHNLGLNTTAPTTAIHIARAFTTTGDYSAMISFENTVSGYFEWQIGPQVLDGQACFSIRGGTDGFGTLSNLFTVNGSNIGIGTATPGYKLHVAGDAYASGSLIFGSHGSWTSGSILSNTAWGCAIRGQQASPSHGHFLFTNSDGTELMRISPSGVLSFTGGATGYAVTAGLSTTAGALVIGAQNINYDEGWNAGLLLECAETTGIAVHDAGEKVASFMYYGTDNCFYMGKAAGHPVTPFTFESDVTINGVFRTTSHWYWTPTTNMYCDATANNQEWSVDLRNQSTYTGCQWHVWSDTLGAILQVHGDTGNVGVGLANVAPGAKFEVRGTCLFNTAHFTNAGAFANGGYVSIQPGDINYTGYVEFRNADTSRMAYIGYGGSVNFNIAVDQARNLVFWTNGANRMMIDKDGPILMNNRVVIQNGTDGTSARGIWYWSATDSNWGTYMAQSGTGKSLADGVACTGAFGFTSNAIRNRVWNGGNHGFIWENSSETCLMSIRADGAGGGVLGKWGVGTVSPGALLHLYGSGNYLTSIHVDADDGAGILLNSTRGSGGRQWSIISTCTGYGIGPGNFGIYDVTGLSYRFMINSAGQTGINKASADYTLDVGGTLHCDGDLYVGNNNSGATTLYFGGPYGDAYYNHGLIQCRTYANVEDTELLLFKGNDLGAAGSCDRIRLRAGGIAFDTYNYHTTDQTAENIRMYIDGDGIVGIGTVSPTLNWAGNGIPNAKVTILGGASGSSGGISRISIGADNRHYAAIEAQHTGSGSTTLSFMTAESAMVNGSNPTTRMSIDHLGNVGIGTSPSHKIHWYDNVDGGLQQYGQNASSGANAYTLIGVQNNTPTQLVMFLNSSNRAADGGVNAATVRNDGGVLRLMSAVSDVQLWAGDANRMNIGLDGNVNIYGNTCISRKALTFSNAAGDFNHSIFNDAHNISGWGEWDGIRMNVFNGLQIRVGNWTTNNEVLSMYNDNTVYVNGRLFCNGWVRPQGDTGIHFESYGRGIWAPDSAGNLYGNVATYGTGRSGWSGYAIQDWYQFMSNWENWGIHNSIDSRWMIHGDRSKVGLRHDNDVKFETVTNGTKTYGRAHSDEIYVYGNAYNEGGWWRNYGQRGLYNETYGCHFYPNVDQYGNWVIHGNEQNGWGGLRFTQSGTDLSLMMGNGSQACGIHANGGGWAFYSDGNRNFFVNGDITAYWSDRRLKENFQEIPDVKGKLMSLTGYFFNWNEKGKKIMGPREHDVEIGLIAQDVQAILPQAVKVNKAGRSVDADNDPDHIDYLTIQYDKVVVLLVEGYKRLQREVDELRAVSDELRAVSDELRARCEMLEKSHGNM